MMVQSIHDVHVIVPGGLLKDRIIERMLTNANLTALENQNMDDELSLPEFLAVVNENCKLKMDLSLAVVLIVIGGFCSCLQKNVTNLDSEE